MKLKTILLSTSLGLSTLTLAQSAPTSCDSLPDSVFTVTDVNKWMDAFKEMFNTDQCAVFFGKDNVKQLHTALGGSTYVRIYYTSTSDTDLTLPGAVFVAYPIDDCSTDYTAQVITADPNGGPGYMGPITDDIKREIQNWQTLYTNNSSLNSLDTVYAYNFTWNHIMEACVNAKNDLWVAYGISNINDAPDSNDAIHMYLTKGEPSSQRLFLDFSRPCPKLCGNVLQNE